METRSAPTSAPRRSFATARGSMNTIGIKNRIEAMFRADDDPAPAATAGAE
ncbi:MULTISPECIES: hypothetical protein [unclassified Rhodococcus (in: high G+C Gram-positive bacteria)]|uniref:hypothetical protein n=1 Tax=unclassified Rhodococcus (in: high G+C Gram-positive bacteria) TaxID=192944 RepID=UPI00163AC6E4|nr:MULTISPECIES: hypothetical protein [unclassified Rhodococcus (in: high G+C Gram-positive bacteria)]MBC2637980.1 hypothetical protein [Rhodococcus sp. 3A]MBC2897273.1 hypothetical protein [Rhodococcus sp. 4CII]